MADTFDQHKTRIDGELPTPPVVFRRLNRHRENLHHEGEVGRFAATFDEVEYTFFAQLERSAGAEAWHINQQNGDIGRQGIVTGEATWEACYNSFRPWWEAFCDRIRSTNAKRDYGLDLIDDTYQYNDNRIAGIRSTQGSLTLTPEFAQSVREYQGSSADPVLAMAIDRKYPRQTITNTWGEEERAGTTRLINISQPEHNPFVIGVVAEDGANMGLYSITFTHTA